MLVDTHSHLNFKDFNKDRGELIDKCLKNNVWLINASSTFNTSELAVEIAEKYPQGVYASVGLHPIHACPHTKQSSGVGVRDEEFDAQKYKELAQSKKVVAIGETGLDYMYPHTKQGQSAKGAKIGETSPCSGVGVYPEQDKQKQVFLQHLALAKELNLPIIFHCRKAHQDMINILQESRRSALRENNEGQTFILRGVVHCFTGKWSEAEQYLSLGLYLGFNGIIYKMNLDEVIKKMPLDRILVETDCPYLSPPEASEARNEPINVKYIAQRIADLRNESFDRIAQATTNNAKTLFKLT